jgi:uncharacterized protein (DUF1330 family)
MPAYFIAEVEITNPTGYDAYRPLAGASIAQYGGKFLAAAARPSWSKARPIRRESSSSNSPTSEAAKRWYNSPEYQEALKIRLANSTGRVLIVEGA